MKTLLALAVGALALLTTGVTLAQSGNMMNGGSRGTGWMGGYGGHGCRFCWLSSLSLSSY
jgi:hypothetical protein